jgi:hypothetical protein
MKHGISIVAVAALMLAAPALGASWIGGTDLLWKTGANWTGGVAPGGGGTNIGTNGLANVLLDWTTTATTSDLDFNGGSTLTIKTNLAVGGDFDFYSGSAHVVIESGTVTAGDDLKIDNEASTFRMISGSFENGTDPGQTGYLNLTNSDSRLEISGGSFTIEGYATIAGTLQVSGDSATKILFGANGADVSLNNNVDIVLKDGGITTIEGGTGAMNLSGTLTLWLHSEFTPTNGQEFDIVTSLGTRNGTFTDNLSGDWSIAYLDDVDVEGVPTDIVRVTYAPEPATMSLLAIGGLALIRRRKRA